MMQHLATSFLAGLALSALPLQAATFTPPAGCNLQMTVQNRGCSVSQYYICDADPEGYQRSAIFGKDGMFHSSVIDAETRWIESTSPMSGITDTLVEGAADEASLSTLLATGRDDFDFDTRANDGVVLNQKGFDVLTGETVQIDGQQLERTEFQLTTTGPDGNLISERRGTQFISREFGRFFGGIESRTDASGEQTKTNDSPVLFAFPGDKGFGDTTPQFDCDQLLTQILQERAAS
ncbi:hypothetical protein [Paracoccus indicus]|uniref:hypothetical protein n=1 Tax=Paracoccus indicus TaxID=2079229 RepID=UPI000D346946|nr:hypothetical protein [Paracoccus indicus]